MLKRKRTPQIVMRKRGLKISWMALRMRKKKMNLMKRLYLRIAQKIKRKVCPLIMIRILKMQ